MIVLTTTQRSPEWAQARLGRLTGTGAAAMLARKTGEAAARRDLRMRLVCERLTGVSQEEPFVNEVMQRGIDLEPAALAAYEARSGTFVTACGFLAHDELMAGCSPDGLDAPGMVEIKCPKTATHVGYLRGGVVPSTYLPQITHNLWITGAAWCDFVSYDPRLPERLQLFVARVLAKDIDLAAYDGLARAFLAEVDAEVAALTALAGERDDDGI